MKLLQIFICSASSFIETYSPRFLFTLTIVFLIAESSICRPLIFERFITSTSFLKSYFIKEWYNSWEFLIEKKISYLGHDKLYNEESFTIISSIPVTASTPLILILIKYFASNWIKNYCLQVKRTCILFCMSFIFWYNIYVKRKGNDNMLEKLKMHLKEHFFSIFSINNFFNAIWWR